MKVSCRGWQLKIYRTPIQNQKKVDENKPTSLDPHKFIPEDYKKVAKGLEQQFVQYMVEQMQKTIGKDDNSTAMNYYKELGQKEQAKLMTETRNGMGIQDLILDEIYPKKFRNQDALNAYKQMKSKSGLNKSPIIMAGPTQEKFHE